MSIYIFLSEQFMPNPIEVAAKEAIRYVQHFVKKGHTHLSNRDLDISQRLALATAMKNIRELADDSPLYQLTDDDALRRFIHRINIIKKYSLGNCSEMSLLALEFIVNNKPELDAKRFTIQDGDHVVLVIGKAGCFESLVEDSKDEPRGLLDDAWICDPWRDDCYPFKQYLTRLSAHYFDDDQVLGQVYPFNERVHRLVPYDLSAAEIRDKKTQESTIKLYEHYINKIQYLESKLRCYMLHQASSNQVQDQDQHQIRLIQDNITALRTHQFDRSDNIDTLRLALQRNLCKAISLFKKCYALTHTQHEDTEHDFAQSKKTLDHPAFTTYAKHRFYMANDDETSEGDESKETLEDALSVLIKKW